MKVGNNEVKDILLGETPIVKVYRGEDVIWERGGLPSGYTRVEYLESTGTQYINTGFYPNNITKVKCRCKCNRGTIFGSRSSANVKSYLFLYTASNDYRTDFGNSPKTIEGFTEKNVMIDVVKDGAITTITTMDARTFSAKNSYTIFESTQPMTLFGLKQDALVSIGEGTMYSCKIYDNGTLVRDFIPCLDTNSRPCMFDLVTKQPFYNQGTGEFLYA